MAQTGSKKQPVFIQMKDTSPMTMAGLWELWHGPGNEVIESCTILTTAANALVKPIHDRMPVIIDPKHIDLWLDPTTQNPELLTRLFKPFPPIKLTAYPVSTIVNSPRNDDPRCLDPLPTNTEPDELF